MSVQNKENYNPKLTTKKQVTAVTQAPNPNTVEGAVSIAANFVEEAASQQAVTVSRAVTARNAAKMRLKELSREKADFQDRAELLRAQYTAATMALESHLADIDEEIQLITTGFGAEDEQY